jgi:hypothetical protein
VFDQSLKFLKSISTLPYVPIDIDVFNDLAYVSTTKATILILQNEKIAGNFSILTPCTIGSSIIDKFGNIAVLCNRNMIYVYSLNGTYLGVKWSSSVFNIDDIQIDLSGSLVLSSPNGIFIMSNQTKPINNTKGFSYDSRCAKQSKNPL